MTPSPLVSFIVPTLRRPALLARCLDSIARTVHEPHEVLCVCAAEDGDTRDLLATRPDARAVVEDRPRGFVRAANAGFRAAAGEHLVQLNDDARLMPFAIENALHLLRAKAHADVGQLAFFHDSPLRRNVYQQVTAEGTTYAVAHVRGLPFANFGMIRRELSERLGHYDERFRMYAADPDLSLRVWHELGLRVLPAPGSLVRHEQTRDDRAAADRDAQADDNARLFEKWNLSPPPAAARAETDPSEAHPAAPRR